MQPIITLTKNRLSVDDQSPDGGLLIIINEGDHLFIEHLGIHGNSDNEYSIPVEYIEKLFSY